MYLVLVAGDSNAPNVLRLQFRLALTEISLNTSAPTVELG